MKDNQIAAKSGEPRIFLISPLLHCVSMTALVYLRSSFGFGYLRPKSVFLAFSWALILYSIYAWIDGAAWHERRSLLLFGLGAVLLYWIHLAIAFYREWHQTGEHEHHSGTSHPIRFARQRGRAIPAGFEETLHLWLEPGTALLMAVILRVTVGANALSAWLVLVGTCLWIKEALNRWFSIRQYKRRRDMFDDTEETIEAPTTSNLAEEPPKATRKAKVKRGRNAEQDDDERERQYAETLRLVPPYDLSAAERNYHLLIKTQHPDASDGSAGSHLRSRELNEAIEFFRAKSRA